MDMKEEVDDRQKLNQYMQGKTDVFITNVFLILLLPTLHLPCYPVPWRNRLSGSGSKLGLTEVISHCFST